MDTNCFDPIRDPEQEKRNPRKESCAFSIMVEAAGVEPASENDSKEITTCVVSLLFSPARTPTDKIPRGPVPEDSPITLERESSASLLLMTPVCAVQTPHHTDGLHLCSQSVRVIVVGF